MDLVGGEDFKLWKKDFPTGLISSWTVLLLGLGLDFGWLVGWLVFPPLEICLV